MRTRLDANLDAIRYLIQEANWDWLVCYDGDERVGKSTLASQVQFKMDGRLRRDVETESWDRVFSHFAHSFPDLIQNVEGTPKSSGHFHDEASLLWREQLQPWNIQMVKTLSVIGYRNAFLSFNFPDFWSLDPFLRNHRCRTRVLVQSFKGNRGYASFYARIKKAFPDRSGRIVWWVPAFNIEFQSLDEWSDPYREFWARYEERDQDTKRRLLRTMGVDWRYDVYERARSKGMTYKDIASLLGISRRQLQNLRKSWQWAESEA